jgi:hypothetical protein
MTAVQTINAPAHQANVNRAGYFAISAREYTSLAKFSNAADKRGLKTAGISRGPYRNRPF